MSKSLPTTNNYKEIFLKNIPLLDVRAPVEFEKGAFPNTTNHPILDDEERRVIGIEHKEHGGDAAVELGHEMIKDDIKAQKISAWKTYLEAHPNAMIYCFRGGKRSRYSQQWIAENLKKEIPLITGGYKAMRQYLLDVIDDAPNWMNPITIGGRTGSGKTKLLLKLKNYIDLEGLAQHKGSAFGNTINGQPTQINFENNLAIALLKHKEKENPPLVLEDEGKHIGRVHFKPEFYNAIKTGPLYILESNIEARIDHIYQEYIEADLQAYIEKYGENGYQKWSEALKNNLNQIKRRLGGDRHAQAMKFLENALSKQLKLDDKSGHKNWIQFLLKEYYDPMYDYHVGMHKERITFRGNAEEIMDKLK